MTTETRNPNDTAQALIAEYGLPMARELARISCDTHTGFATRSAAFWADVATLLRLETQDDESTPE